jgi:hypothetical protein
VTGSGITWKSSKWPTRCTESESACARSGATSSGSWMNGPKNGVTRAQYQRMESLLEDSPPPADLGIPQSRNDRQQPSPLRAAVRINMDRPSCSQVARVGPTTPTHFVRVGFGLLSHWEPVQASVASTSPIAARPIDPPIARVCGPKRSSTAGPLRGQIGPGVRWVCPPDLLAGGPVQSHLKSKSAHMKSCVSQA